MSPLLIALLGILLLPLFVATWRMSLFGLAAQGLLMGWIAYRMGPPPTTASEWLTLVDLVVVRGLWAPLALYGILRAQGADAHRDVVAPNLLTWTVALGMVVASFTFSEALVAESGQQQTLISVAGAGVLLGFLVLATQASPLSQMMGALRIENAIALFELGGERHHEPLWLQLAQTSVVALTVLLYRRYLSMLGGSAAPTEEGALEEPTI